MINNIYYTLLLKDSIELSGLDFILYNEIFGDFDFDMSFPYKLCDENNKHIKNYPIKIDTIIDRLEYMKKNGANYISINYESNNYAYNIDSYEIYASSESEIKAHLDDKQAKQEKYNKMLIDLERLKKEIFIL